LTHYDVCICTSPTITLAGGSSLTFLFFIFYFYFPTVTCLDSGIFFALRNSACLLVDPVQDGANAVCPVQRRDSLVFCRPHPSWMDGAGFADQYPAYTLRIPYPDISAEATRRYSTQICYLFLEPYPYVLSSSARVNVPGGQFFSGQFVLSCAKTPLSICAFAPFSLSPGQRVVDSLLAEPSPPLTQGPCQRLRL